MSAPSHSSGNAAPSAPYHPPAFLASDVALTTFFEIWAAGRLPKSEWTHAAHVATAACYAFEHDVDGTFARMKAGIIRHNESVGTANTETSGYHETLTRFWAGEICRLVHSGRHLSRFEAVRAAVDKFASQRDCFRHFYSFDVVNDRRARREWIAPDLAPTID